MDTSSVLNSLETDISEQHECHVFSEIHQNLKDHQAGIRALFAGNNYEVDKGHVWEVIPDHLAKDYFVKFVGTALAYSMIVFDEGRCIQFWERLDAIKKGTAAYYTSTKGIEAFIQSNRRSWFPVTRSTFDNTFVVVDEEKIVAIVITDED